MGGVFICMILTACENFLEGSQVKKDLEAQIDYASMQKYDVEVSLPGYETDLLTEYGEISAEGNKELLVGDTFTIFFLMNSKYEFVKYYVYDKTSRKQCYDALSFKTIMSLNENTVTIQTTAKLLKPVDSLLIIPECNLVNDYDKPHLQSMKVAVTETDLKNGNFCINQWRYKGTIENLIEPDFNNHAGKSVFISLTAYDNSTINSIQIGERKINGESDYSDRAEEYYTFYDCPYDYTLSKLSGEDSLYYDILISDYYIHKEDGPVELAVKLFDGSGNTITYVYNDYDCVTVIKDSKCNSEYYLSNADIYDSIYSQSQTELLSKKNEDGSIDMSFSFYATPEKYLDFAAENWDDLKWEYAVTQDYKSLESIDLQSFLPVFTDSTETIKKASNSLSVHINNPEKAAYIKFKKTDSAGNTAVKVFFVPAIPKICDQKFHVWEGQKRLKVTAIPGDINENINTLIHCIYSIKRVDTTTHPWGKTEVQDKYTAVYYDPSTFSIHQYNAGDTGYGYADEAQYYICTANEENGYRIYSALSDVRTVSLSELSSMNRINFGKENISFTAGETDNMQKVTVTLNPDEITGYNCFCLRHPVTTNYDTTYSYSFFEGNEFSFTIQTEWIFNNILYIYLMALSDNDTPRYFQLSITNDCPSRYIDNIRPSCKTMMHYPHGYLFFSASDTGYGLDEENLSLAVYKFPYYELDGHLDGQNIKVNFNCYNISTSVQGISVYNNLHRIPYTIDYRILDVSGNETEFICPYELPEFKNDAAYSLSNSGDTSIFTISSFEDNLSAKDFPVSWDIISPEKEEYIAQLIYRWHKGEHWLTPVTLDNGKTFNRTISPATEGFLRIFAADSRPLYFWSKGIQKAEISDIIEFSKGIQIYSDVPFYIHTLYSRINWGNDIDKWENYSVLGVKDTESEIDGSTEVKIECHNQNYSTTPYYYTFPESNEFHGLEGLFYYTTIVHFADGTSLMSTVKSKNLQ
jgi:hypothetical protein